MQYIISLFLVVSFCQPLYSHSYVDSLDAIIDEKTAVCTKSNYRVAKIARKIRKNIKTQVSLQDIEDFLDSKNSVAVLFCKEMQVKANELSLQEQQEFQDLQFSLGAKLYMHYLECAKQKMFYQAVKNYDALNYWQNEKFYQSQSFFQKGIFRSLSGSGYTELVMNNLQLLQNITQQTNAFLGLMLHSQQLLQKATTLPEFEQALQQAICLQNELLHVQDQAFDTRDMATIMKLSINQLSQLSFHLSNQHAQCKMPVHVVRHWKGYAATSVAACTAAFIYLRYGRDIAHATQHFYEEHVYGAFDRNRKVLSGVIEGPQFSVDENKKNAEGLMDQILQRPLPRTHGDPLEAFWQDLNTSTNGIPQQVYTESKDVIPFWPPSWKGKLFFQSIAQTVNDTKKFAKESLEATNREIPVASDELVNLSFEEKKERVLPVICTIKKHKDLNTFAFLDAADLELELKVVEGQEAMNSVLKDVHMALGITALIPVITLIGGSFFASKSLYNSVAYQPIRTLVRRLEVFLNEIYYEAVTFDKDGHIYFLTEQLKLNIHVLTIDEQKLITADIEALQAPSLDYVQKTNVVQRMYRTYPCLIPARV
ncbi:MAG: hypothetical protein Q8Q60_00555 [Candidatus Chromulinivorax sp.]|nr:hypothetical protein [Candidatus Chromulinivorax sp.]